MEQLDIAKGKLRCKPLWRMMLYFLVAAGSVAVAFALWKRQGNVQYDDEASWVQVGQGGCYVLGFVIAVMLVRRLRSMGCGEWRIVMLIAAGMAFLAWREIELDDYIFGVHMFSLKYLLKNDIPLSTKLAMGIPGITIIVALLAWIVCNGRGIAANIRVVLWQRGLAVFAAGAVVLIVAQIFDRAGSVYRRLSMVIPGVFENDKVFIRNVEESLELAGAILVLFSVVELANNLSANIRSRSNRA